MSPILLLFLAASLLLIFVTLIAITALRYYKKHRDEGLLFDPKNATPEYKKLKQDVHAMHEAYIDEMPKKIAQKNNEILTKIDLLRAHNPESADEVAKTYQSINPDSKNAFNDLLLLLININAKLASLGLTDVRKSQDFEESFVATV